MSCQAITGSEAGVHYVFVLGSDQRFNFSLKQGISIRWYFRTFMGFVITVYDHQIKSITFVSRVQRTSRSLLCNGTGFFE